MDYDAIAALEQWARQQRIQALRAEAQKFFRFARAQSGSVFRWLGHTAQTVTEHHAPDEQAEYQIKENMK